MDWKNSTNQSAQPTALTDLNNYVSAAPFPAESPIDVFYQESQDYLKLASPKFLASHPKLGPLIFVGFVSVTENYFRSVFSKILEICPVARKCSVDCNIKLGSVLWDNSQSHGRGALEHQSFADSKTIRNMSKNILGHQLKLNGSVETVLEEFSKICEIRHSIVHAANHLAAKNAVSLQINPTGDLPMIDIQYTQLQEIADVCTMLVVSFNTEMFEELCQRWALNWRKLPSWDDKKQNKKFKKIWECFYSKIDEKNGTISNPLSIIKCRNQIKKQYNI